jgi:hypothetical protein
MKKSGRKHSKLSLMRKKLTLRSKISPVQYPRNIGDEGREFSNNIEQEDQANEAHEIHKEAQAGGPSHDNDEEEQQNLVVSQVR